MFFEVSLFGFIATYATIAIIKVFDKLGRSLSTNNYVKCKENSKHKPKTIPALWLLYGENCENYDKPIDPISPHNTVSEITRENGLFVVSIENTITGDKKTLTCKDKWELCQEADDVACRFAIRERDEFHTI